MKVAVIKQHGSPQSISFEDQTIPNPAESEVLIKVKACGLNHLDVWVRRGVEGHKFPLPIVPGSDITGVIEKTGKDVKNFKAGDRVIVDPGICCGKCEQCITGHENLCAKWGLLGESCDGGCREFLSIDETQVHILPEQISFEQGACIPIAYVTAWQMLVEKAKIKQNESILIHAAGSGVSVAAIQIAKMFGLQIFVTSTSEEKLLRAKQYGAHRFINTSKDSFKESVKNLTSKQGVDVVVDHVGAPTFMDSIRVLKRGGRLVSCGATGGADLAIDWKHVFFKNLSLIGSTYGTKKDFASVLDAFAQGKLTAVVDKTLRLEELPLAHESLENRKVFGKIVISFS